MSVAAILLALLVVISILVVLTTVVIRKSRRERLSETREVAEASAHRAIVRGFAEVRGQEWVRRHLSD